MTPSYHAELASRAKTILSHTGKDWRSGEPFLLAPTKDVISILWELVFLVEADAAKERR